MNVNRLSAISIILSIVAISLSGVTFYLTAIPFQTLMGKPSFYIENYPFGVEVFNDFTRIHLKNNGTVTAHNIMLTVIFAWGGPELTEFVPELSPNRIVIVRIPVGWKQIDEHRTLFVHIECNELAATTTFQFAL